MSTENRIQLCVRRSHVCVTSIVRHCRTRRNLVGEHRSWLQGVFTDKSRICWEPDNHRIFRWRERGVRNNFNFVPESSESWWVHGLKASSGHADLCIIRDYNLRV
ncbi:hypothetical protein AVEN_133934-1 [Araneus ventricosus]|uniref:Uncharacterized protein n=1 Tax=Araneus ventricosus TaxID=182803 RepID=A0A4Y2D536_ARAVE|nr:hypothetical protein AVEN_133934-1 [Araneus ventricosus]